MESKGSRKENGEGREEISGWDDPIVRVLEELLLENMRLIFESAIKEIGQWGYEEEAIEKAISRRGLFAGSKDPVTSIVSFTLNLLWIGEKFDSSMDFEFDNIRHLTIYTLMEMIGVIREVRPFLSVSEAMWYLLICDLNVMQACQFEPDSFNGLRSNGSSGYTLTQLRTEAMSNMTQTLTFQDFVKCLDPKNPNSPKLAPKEEENLASMFRKLENFCGFYEENGRAKSQPVSTRRGRLKREMARLAPRPCNVDRSFRAHGPKGSTGTGKLASEVTNSKYKCSYKIDMNLKISSTGTPATSSKSLSLKENTPTQTRSSGSKPDLKSFDSTGSQEFSEFCANIPYDELLGKFLPQDKNEEIVLNLVFRLHNLQDELRGWTEWANQKVMQAARKLGRVQPELKTMRQLTEVAKKSVKDSNFRRLTILENGVNGVNSLVEKGSSVISKLEEENSRMKRELEAAKSKVTESSSDYQAAVERELKAKHEIQSWDGEIGFLQKELEMEKKKLATLQHDLVKAKNSRNKIESTLEKEQNETEKLLAKAELIKNERKQFEAAAKAELNTIKHKAYSLEQKRIEDIKKLKTRFSKSLSKSEKQKLEAKCLVIVKGDQNCPNGFASDGLIQDRECVVCLAEENSVVLLPCSHQILCESCSELHEKRGMTDCPSCRAPIQRRIKVRFAKS